MNANDVDDFLLRRDGKVGRAQTYGSRQDAIDAAAVLDA